MKCLYCQQREATTNDLFCQMCADELSQEDMQRLRNTLIGQGMLLAKVRDEFVQRMKRLDRAFLRLVIIMGVSTMFLIVAILLISK